MDINKIEKSKADILRSEELHKTPIIRTFESDVLESSRINNLDPKSVLAAEMDSPVGSFGDGSLSEVYLAAEKAEKRKRILNVTIFSFIFLIIFSVGGYFIYNTYFKKVEPVKVVEVKRWTVLDYWYNPSKELNDFTADATATKDYIIINIKNFDMLYPYVLNNENILKEPAKKVFGYDEIQNFSDFSVDNIDTRITDGEGGPLLYGFVARKYFVISNNLDQYLKIVKALQ